MSHPGSARFNPTRRSVLASGAALTGLGSILGTGVFVSLGLAAGVAGPAVVLAVVLAAGVAACNGLSSAQLAARHPVSGGTYEYGYRELSPALGFTAGSFEFADDVRQCVPIFEAPTVRDTIARSGTKPSTTISLSWERRFGLVVRFDRALKITTWMRARRVLTRPSAVRIQPAFSSQSASHPRSRVPRVMDPAES